jgi:hypothetical protein
MYFLHVLGHVFSLALLVRPCGFKCLGSLFFPTQTDKAYFRPARNNGYIYNSLHICIFG